ncbi:unnamed protein product (macronuclear) [Paramecium tetraurelia]|uniref:VWFA domain-containing protein n=1 Tax=Paramecium tetraurelia TaxID=5888 RepID=A0EGB5_PARTE|nr:uncharacterized protein GSPATT00026680001 [Paramecium tetraurelia]CAK94356.1 unnamed protein product [Paramecium tetraurelia]|eukprot:XP_001461729.1 hypothetical protein (macronuclear) [Paramecium tetraurelia strain d4-2]
MAKRSKSIERTIKEAEQYLSRFPNSIEHQRQNKINQKHSDQVPQKQGRMIQLQASKKEIKQDKQNVKSLQTTQKTLKEFFKNTNPRDDNIQSKVLDNHKLLKVAKDQQEQQEQVDVSQILGGDQQSIKVIIQNDKNKEQQQDANNKKASQDWWKSIFYQGNRQGQSSIKSNSSTSFLKPRTVNQNINTQQKEKQKQEEPNKKIKQQEAIVTSNSAQGKKTLLSLTDLFVTQKSKMNSITKYPKSNEELNSIQVKDHNMNNKDEYIKKDASPQVTGNKEDSKLLLQIQNKEDGQSEKEHAKLQSKMPNEQKVIQSQSIMQSQVPECEFGMVDCVFVVDTTGSMDPYLERTTEAVEMIVNKIKQQSLEEQVSVKFGLVCYRDHPPQELTYVTEVHNLCSRSEIISIIKQADCYGGGDGAEAALDGLNEAVKKISWRDSSTLPSLRYIFHICDQPPHGKEFGGYSELWDEGCPCGLKPEEVVNRINRNEIHYRLIMANGPMLQRFAQYLRGKIHNYDETTLDVAIGMEIRISDMVIRELCPYTQQE